MDEDKNFPTMIIPEGTEISVNEQGQLSIRTPGNLVIQNSGMYSVIESGSGSVRIDPKVKVEAVSVQAADSCYVAGELTAWRVRARNITLERGAQANIMLQESDSLELDGNARLVGNFASEKELYLMLGRFSRQLRQLPQGMDMTVAERELPATGKDETDVSTSVMDDEEPFVSPDGEDEPNAVERQKREEVLSLARIVLERELGRASLADGSRQALERLLELVRAQNYESLEESYQYLLSQVESPTDELDRVKQLLDRSFTEDA
ncbi:MAG: hypothetical protein GY906_31560 [bacterium]|nr:hypothetical protein [bacterium]